MRVWEGLWKQEGAERETSSNFCPLFVLCYKYRIGPVGRGERRRGGNHGIVFITRSPVIVLKKFECPSI